MPTKIEKTDKEWREALSPEAYEILRRGATERPFTNDNIKAADGMFRCGACNAELFKADDKFESGSGWPSFTEPALAGAVELKQDGSHGMVRTEVVCATCGGHLGHVFDDGPQDKGGMRYCINGAALDAVKG